MNNLMQQQQQQHPYKSGAAAYKSGADEGQMYMWEATQMLQSGVREASDSTARVIRVARNLHQVLENTRLLYNNVVTERDAILRKLQAMDSQLLQVENIVRRYAQVQDPVIASDGFTYERALIEQYLKECSQSNSKAYSQQTKEELSDAVVANQSLKRLVDSLKGVRTTEVPQLPYRTIIGPVHPSTAMGADPLRTGWVEDDGMNRGRNALETAAAAGEGNSAAGSNPRRPTPHVLTNQSSAQSHGNRRFDHPGGKFGGAKGGGGGNADVASGNGGGTKPALHPCLRVYGFCNFMSDCTFANYPYEACLNHIKGKCRFGANCKELHVDPRDPKYYNPRSSAPNNHTHHQLNNVPTNQDRAATNKTAASATAATTATAASKEAKTAAATSEAASTATAVQANVATTTDMEHASGKESATTTATTGTTATAAAVTNAGGAAQQQAKANAPHDAAAPATPPDDAASAPPPPPAPSKEASTLADNSTTEPACVEHGNANAVGQGGAAAADGTIAAATA